MGGLGFRIGVGFGSSDFGGSGLRISGGSGFLISRFMASGFGLGLGSRVQGFGFRLEGLVLRFSHWLWFSVEV